MEERSGVQDTSSSFADEGTAAHQVAEWALNSETKQADQFLGSQTDVGIFPDQDMCDFVQKYVDDVMSYVDPDNTHNMLYVEQKVDFSEAIGVEESYGTADAVIVADNGKELQVHDLKFGKGVRVDAEENTQLALYALGALNKFGFLGSFERIRLVIHQPRLNHLSEWELTVNNLLTFGCIAKTQAERVVGYLNMPKEEDIPMTALDPSESACRWCKAKATCQALRQYVSKTVADDFEVLDGGVEQAEEKIQLRVDSVEHLSDTALSKARMNSDLVMAWCKAIEAETYNRLEKGEQVDGFKMVQGRQGNRSYADKDEAETLLKQMRIPQDTMYKKTLATPTQMVKALAGNPRKLKKLEAIIVRPEGKPTVVPVSDKRPALEMKKVADEFETVHDFL